MLDKFKREKKTIDKEIESVLDAMSNLDQASDEYAKMAANLERLLKAKSYDKQQTINPNTALVVAANIVGILMILGYEQTGVIRSKAMSFILKGRV